MTKSVPFWMASMSALMLSVPADGALIDYDFTDSGQVDEWSFSTESTTDVVGDQVHLAASSDPDNTGLSDHDGALAWQIPHTGDSLQAAMGWATFGAADLSGWELQTTGIHAKKDWVLNIWMLLQYDDNGDTKYAVSDQSIRTSTGESSPVPGQWNLDDLTFSALDPDDLLDGPGASLDTSTVLGNATGAGYFSSFLEEHSWESDAGPVLTSFTVIPEPASLALVGLGGLVLLRRRRS